MPAAFLDCVTFPPVCDRDVEQLWLFITLTFLVSASPGPVMLTCMADAARAGFRKSLFTMAGASVGNLLLMLVSALGLELLLDQAQFIFHLIKWLGAGYLVYLGLRLLFAALPLSHANTSIIPGTHLFGKAFLVAVTNPKGLIYFGALFPQFIDIHQPMPPQFALLTLVFLSMDLCWMAVYAVGGSGIMRWLQSPRHQRWFNWISGCAFIAAGGLLWLAPI